MATHTQTNARGPGAGWRGGGVGRIPHTGHRTSPPGPELKGPWGRDRQQLEAAHLGTHLTLGSVCVVCVCAQACVHTKTPWSLWLRERGSECWVVARSRLWPSFLPTPTGQGQGLRGGRSGLRHHPPPCEQSSARGGSRPTLRPWGGASSLPLGGGSGTPGRRPLRAGHTGSPAGPPAGGRGPSPARSLGSAGLNESGEGAVRASGRISHPGRRVCGGWVLAPPGSARGRGEAGRQPAGRGARAGSLRLDQWEPGLGDGAAHGPLRRHKRPGCRGWAQSSGASSSRASPAAAEPDPPGRRRSSAGPTAAGSSASQSPAAPRRLQKDWAAPASRLSERRGHLRADGAGPQDDWRPPRLPRAPRRASGQAQRDPADR